MEWIFDGDNSTATGSFYFCAKYLDLDPEVVRTGVRAELDREKGATMPSYSKVFDSLGDFLHAVRYAPDDSRLRAIEMRQQSMGVGAEGGFAVPTEFLPQILGTAVNAIVRPRAFVVPAGRSPDAALSVPTLDSDCQAVWLSEAGTKPDTPFTLKGNVLTPHELVTAIICSDRLFRNISGGAAALAELLGRALARAEDQAFLTGSGVGQPLGVANAPCIVSVGRAGAGAIAAADVYGMRSKLLPGGQAVWVASPSAAASLGALMDNGSGTILGLPVLFSALLPALGTAGDLMLCDFSQYMIQDGTQVAIAVSADHPNHFRNGEVLVKAFRSVDGQPWLSAPVDGLSPFVVLN